MTTTFKTISLGTKKPSLKGVCISSYAQDLIDKITYQTEKEDIELVIKTPKELGCTEQYPTTNQIFDAAKEKALELCPAEVGPRLREVYDGTDWLVIAMEPITDRDGDPRVFNLSEVGGELGLSAYDARAVDGWFSDDRFVFRRRKTLKPSGSSFSLCTLETLSLRVSELSARVEELEDIISHRYPALI